MLAVLSACSGQGPNQTVSPAELPSTGESASALVDPTASAGVSAQPGPSGDEGFPAGLIAYAGGEDPQIHLLDPQTGESRQLTDLVPADGEPALGNVQLVLTCGFGISGLEWSPDGSRIAFSYGSCGTVVHVVTADGAVERIADGRLPRWSPDGASLAFGVNAIGGGSSPPSIAILDLSTGESRRVSVDGPFTDAYAPIWSPDGSRIAFSGLRTTGVPETAVLVLDVATGDVEEVAHGAYPGAWVGDDSIVITTNEFSTSHVLNLASGETVDLGVGSHALPAPDATTIAVTDTSSASGAATTRLLTATGEEIGTAEGMAMAWAPDSSALLVSASDPTAQPNLTIVDRQGNALATFEGVAPIGYAASWQPTGD